LEIALGSLLVAGKGGLGLLVLELIEDLPVCNVAHLEVLLDELAVLVANTTLAVWHHGVACVVRFADIAIDACPTIATLALLLAASWCAILSVW
jgi:hypothetical protein